MKTIEFNEFDRKFAVDYYTNTYLDDVVENAPLVVICPGGGFKKLAPHEMEPIALEFNAHGYQAAVLKYSLLDQGEMYPAVIKELELAIQQIANPGQNVVVIGFSAGAQIAALFNGLNAGKMIGDSIKLAATVLCYPVIDLTEGFPKDPAQIKTFTKDDKYIKAQDLVNHEMAPTFIWQTTVDQTVPIKNSLLYWEALLDKNVENSAAHFFNEGPHGMSLGNSLTARTKADIQPRTAVWVDLMFDWLTTL